MLRGDKDGMLRWRVALSGEVIELASACSSCTQALQFVHSLTYEPYSSVACITANTGDTAKLTCGKGDCTYWHIQTETATLKCGLHMTHMCAEGCVISGRLTVARTAVSASPLS